MAARRIPISVQQCVDDRMGGNGFHVATAHDASSVLLAWFGVGPRVTVTSLAERIRDHRLAAATVSFAFYTTIMLVLERRMRRTGGPGIIPFELAGSASRAEDIMTRWGSDGQRAARLSLWLDFGYMATYGTFTALLVDRARRRRGHPAALPAMVIVAVAADATEGVSLLKVLNGTNVAGHSRLAQIAALIKFAVLAVCLGYVATDLGSTVRRSQRPPNGRSHR